MKLSAAALLLLMSCAASPSATSRQTWRISLTSSGGIHGRGAGSYAIDSGGAITVVTMNGRECTFTAAEEELRRIAALVDAAHPESWSQRYVPDNPCCDRYEYTMTVERDGVGREVIWIDDPPPMPEDLQALTGAIITGADSIRVRYGDRCRQD